MAAAEPTLSQRTSGLKAVRVATALTRSSAVKILTKRLLEAVVLLFAVSALSFVLIALTPGDPARALAGGQAGHAQYAQIRHELRLDESLPSQYVHWLAKAVDGDFGNSLFTQEPVTSAISARLPATFSLIVGALLVSLIIGVTLGVFSAVRGGFFARVVDSFALIAFAIPPFWAGAILIAVFAINLGVLPATGYVEFGASPVRWLESLILPVVALSMFGVAAIAKQTREAMLDALSSEHIRIAWATGISSRSILYRHALKNASLRVVTVVGWLFVALLGGTVFVESMFATPGIGALAVEAANRHDVPIIQGVVIYFTVIVVLVNLTVDLLYLALDPRVRLR